MGGRVGEERECFDFACIELRSVGDEDENLFFTDELELGVLGSDTIGSKGTLEGLVGEKHSLPMPVGEKYPIMLL